MLCEKDYNFNFNLGRCLKKPPSINNCVASVTKPTNEEICLTSSLDYFQVSREINQCDSFISNCSICFLDYNNKLTCLACESNYVIVSGICYESEEQSALYLNEFWSLKVTSFLMNLYQNYNYNTPLQLYPCGNFCNQCKLSLGEYYCEECDQIEISQRFNDINNICKTCSPLCQICKEQPQVDIQKIAPFLQTSYLQDLYTKKCIFPFIDPFISYNPYLKTTQYCLKGDCNNELTYEIIQYELDYFGIQTEYLNSIGAVSMTIIIRIETYDEYCTLMPTITTTASLKFYVFTLQVIHLKLLSIYPFYIEIDNQILIEEYDSFTMIDYGIIFPNLNNYDFNISNSYNEVNFTLINITIKDSLIQNVQSLFKTQKFGYVELQNISIINTQIINSSLFNFNAFSLMGNIRINQLYLFNCNFTNSMFFEFSYIESPIKFINLTMDQCSLQNSSIFQFLANNPLDIKIYLASVSIFRSYFNHSYFFYCSQQVDFIATNLVFNQNELLDSITFGFSSGLQSSYIQINNNIFIESSFMSTVQMISQQQVSCNLMHLIIKNNKLQNSDLFRFFSEFKSSDLFIRLDNALIGYNVGLIIGYKDQQLSYTLNKVSYLFNINGKTIILKNFSIYETKNVYILYFFDSQNIDLENFIFENSEVEEKVSVQTSCLQNQNFQNQIISIIGFNIIYISNLQQTLFKVWMNQQLKLCLVTNISKNKQVKQQYQILSLMEIFYSEQYQFIFYQRIAIQSLNQIIYFSLLTIISDRTLDILIKNVVFQNNIMHTYNEILQRIQQHYYTSLHQKVFQIQQGKIFYSLIQRFLWIFYKRLMSKVKPHYHISSNRYKLFLFKQYNSYRKFIMQIKCYDKLFQFIHLYCFEIFENEQYLGEISQYSPFKDLEQLLQFDISELRLDLVTNQIDLLNKNYWRCCLYLNIEFYMYQRVF